MRVSAVQVGRPLAITLSAVFASVSAHALTFDINFDSIYNQAGFVAFHTDLVETTTNTVDGNGAYEPVSITGTVVTDNVTYNGDTFSNFAGGDNVIFPQSGGGFDFDIGGLSVELTSLLGTPSTRST